MRCGLFGKLPAKRDFIAVAAPRDFLRLWEPWLEKGLAEARAHVPEGDFAAAFNTAPIWRFWLGPALCGKAFVGAFMPSVDALGRMFPLTLIGDAGDADRLDPPDIDPRQQWFAAMEALLLDALDPDASLAAIVSRLDQLCADADASHRDAIARRQARLAPGHAKKAPENREIETFADGAAAENGVPAMFEAMRLKQPDCPPEAATFWWTIGGADWPPLAMMHQFMPAPTIFAEMLSRRRNHPDDVQQESRLQAIAQPG